MISHSLVQGGPGFPYLAPSIFWYLATGDLQTALGKASCADVQNNDLIKYIEKISDASDSDLAAITFESGFIQLMCEAGETRVVTPDNKLDVLQSLMLHDILVKRKSILDQLRKSLSTLGVLAEIEYNPSLFEEFFLDQGGVKLLTFSRFLPAQCD
ncbi:PREDICTED: uncharacterized protein LOC107338599 [Acropora digitifera]|uniref:uncharacterized protein LOC107338599 n=1 Tax=Acropora digitifera TaxID=70779 RepID=UPI000779F7C9|nr:PREDICTED: uncharacterized protein LOC107338599 [Acropora digitifera]